MRDPMMDDWDHGERIAHQTEYSKAFEAWQSAVKARQRAYDAVSIGSVSTAYYHKAAKVEQQTREAFKAISEAQNW